MGMYLSVFSSLPLIYVGSLQAHLPHTLNVDTSEETSTADGQLTLMSKQYMK